MDSETGELAFLPLGGTGEIGMNLNLYRWRDAQPVVPLDLLLSRALRDCGVLNFDPDIESFLHLARTTGAQMDLSSFLVELESLANAADLDRIFGTRRSEHKRAGGGR